jgi:V/A-type H+-transporting ATPase subunit I
VFSPEPMRHLSLVVMASDLEAATRAIAHEGVLHLLDVRQSSEVSLAVTPYDVSTRVARLDALRRALDDIGAVLALAPDAALTDGDADTNLDLESVAARIEAINHDTADLRQQLGRTVQDEMQLQQLLRNLRAFAPIGMPVETLRGLRYVYLASGLLPERNLARLRESLTRIPHLLTTSGGAGSGSAGSGGAGADGRLLVAALCLRANQEVLERALRSAQFEPVELPPELRGTPEEGIAKVEETLAAVRQVTAGLEAKRRAHAQQLGPEVYALHAWIAREQLLAEARGRMGYSERSALIIGWVPAIVSQRLDQALRSVIGRRCIIQWSDPGALDEVRHGRIPVPILLHNPVLIRPFERLVRNYGMPRYGEVEPTAVVAVGFLTMFGFMFGDIGQGLVLFAIGYFIYRRMFRYRDYAIILMECGTFATGFGFLYGSVFGSEHWVPALWLRPLEDMATLMTTAVAFGVVFLSVGLALNLLNAARRRDAAMLWQRNGVLFALGYWIAVGLAVRRVTGGPGTVSVGTVVLWLAIPLGLLLLHTPAALLWHALRQRQRPEVAEVFASLVESVVEVLDTVISSISNTATFIRLAAFALSHAGLFMATFSVADAVAHTAGGTIGAAAVIILGNAVIIALEGLIVSIQSIRLEYYEFFSKFYSGGGEEYRPLHIAALIPGKA